MLSASTPSSPFGRRVGDEGIARARQALTRPLPAGEGQNEQRALLNIFVIHMKLVQKAMRDR